MTRHVPSKPPDLTQATSQGMTSSKKRKFRDVYNPSAKEQFPDVPWYDLDYQTIIDLVHEMLDDIIVGLKQYTASDSGIKGVIDAAEEAKSLPDLEKCCMAVLGEQAAGKSTLITALIGGRKLLDRSGDTKSCTAVPTVIVHKKGADDDTRLSDVTIEWMGPEECLAHIQEQIARWADVFPGTKIDEGMARKDIMTEAEDNAEEDADDDSDEDVDDFSVSDPEEDQDYEQSKSKPRKKRSRKLENAAATAKEFFQTIFITEEDEEAEEQLEEKLYTTDIRQRDFEAICVAKLKDRFRQLDTQLQVKENTSKFLDVSDIDLREKRHLAKRLWPFVKVITIATGHILLRYGMCFFDLPGFGDTNQLRAAHINRFRWKADLELIVAESSRIRTNKTLNKHIADSVHIKKKAGGTIVVMNKTDALLDETDIGEHIFHIKEDPFPNLYQRLLEITAQIEDEDNEDLSLQDQLDDLVKEANLAYVTRESRRAREQLQSKGAAFFAASAKSWLEWRDRMRKKDPLLDPEASGIPRITRHFLEIPASTNLKKYHDHVHRVLPAFRARCARVLKKHTEDQQYAKMRKHFAAQIPKVTTELEMALPEIVKQAIVEPWSEHDGKEIKKGIKSLFEEKWKHPDILVHGWGKILRENGIPVDGAYLGRNLNEEILETVQTYIDGWSDESTDRAENLAKAIYQPVQDVLKTVEVDLQTCRATPELTDATTEALEEKAEEIKAAYDRLLGKLHDSLDDTHLRFTTEIDIECPIAQTMKPSYKRASDPDFVSSGRGIYNRQRKVLQDSMLRPKRHYIRLAREERIKPLVHTLKEKLVSSQIEVWNQDCMSFVRDTTELLEEFSQTTKDLLMDAAFMKEEHRKAREELKRMLVVFDERLEEVQNEFVNLGPPTPTKKVKVEIEEEPRPFIAPSISNQQNSTAVTTATSDVESVPISQDWGWHHFLANMHPLRSD